LKESSKKKSKRVLADINKTIVVVDCSTLAYAAFYSYGHLTYGDKQTGVIFGFLQKIIQIAERFNTNRFIFCWDSSWTFREKDYDGYKEKRHNKRDEMTPDEIEAQLSVVMQREKLRAEVLPAMGFRNSFIFDGYEADDLLAIYSRKLSRFGPVVMVTTDMDMYQCLDCCDIYNPRDKKVFTHCELLEKFGVDACQWPMAKAIGGCDSDGVVGIFGASDPKKPTSKALKYIKGDLCKGKIYDRIKSKEGQKTIKKNLPIVTTPYRPEEFKRMILRRDQFTSMKLITVFEKYGLNSFLKAEKLNLWKEYFINE
jgi:5'-3' exonuclease